MRPCSYRSCPDLLREAEVGDAIAVQMAELAAAEGEGELAAAARPGRHARPGRDLFRDQFACSSPRVMCASLQVQVNLKSRANLRTMRCMSERPDDRRDLAAQRRGCVGASLLRGEGPDQLGARGIGPPPLSATGPAPDRVHRLRPADRADARRDRPRARQAARRTARRRAATGPASRAPGRSGSTSGSPSSSASGPG